MSFTKLPGLSFGPRIAGETLEDRLTPVSVSALVTYDYSMQSALPGDATILGTSTDGRYFIFQSQGTHVIDKQVTTNTDEWNLFWQDSATGERRLVSHLKWSQSLATSGFEPYVPGGIMTAVISGDGQSVAFTSKRNASDMSSIVDATGTPGRIFDAGDSSADIFWWNYTFERGSNQIAASGGEITDETILVSRELATVSIIGNPPVPPQLGVPPTISGANSKVVWGYAVGNTSSATNPSISSDGKYISFVSNRDAAAIDSITFLDNNDFTPDIFRVYFPTVGYDSANTLVFEGTFALTASSFFNLNTSALLQAVGYVSSGVQVDPLGRYMSADGTGFTYVSDMSPNKIDVTFPVHTPGTQDVYYTRYEDADGVVYLFNQTTALVTSDAGANGVSVNGKGYNAIIPKDASRTVVFMTTSSTGNTLVPGYVNNNGGGPDIFERTVGGISAQITVSGGAILLGQTSVGPTSLVTAAAGSQTNGLNGTLDISPTSFDSDRLGNKIAFTSSATNAVSGLTDTNATFDIFVRDTNANTTTPVSVRDVGTQTGNGQSLNPRINRDGSMVAFESKATNLVQLVDTNGGTDIFVRNLNTSQTGVASAVPDNSSTGDAPSTFPVIGGDENHGYVYFNSQASDLTGNFIVPNSYQEGYRVPLPFATVGRGRGVAISGGASGYAAIASANDDGSLTVSGAPYTPFIGWNGELRVAAADVNGDGIADLIVAPGPGGGPRLKIINGATQKTMYDAFIFERSFTGGLFVAAADLNNDGLADIVVGAGEGGGPRVTSFISSLPATGTGIILTKVADTFVYEESFRGGVRVATGDVNGDGTPDVVTSPALGGGPRITVLSGADPSLNKVLANFYAFESSLRNGAYVGVGDVNGDGLADVAVGAGPGGAPRVSVFTSQQVLYPTNGTEVVPTNGGGTTDRLFDFYAFSAANTQGVRVALKNVNGDAYADLVTGIGGGAPEIRVFTAQSQGTSFSPTPQSDQFAFDQTIGTFGAWVG